MHYAIWLAILNYACQKTPTGLQNQSVLELLYEESFWQDPLRVQALQKVYAEGDFLSDCLNSGRQPVSQVTFYHIVVNLVVQNLTYRIKTYLLRKNGEYFLSQRKLFLMKAIVNTPKETVLEEMNSLQNRFRSFFEECNRSQTNKKGFKQMIKFANQRKCY
jgi:hypothetical protein